MPNAEEHGVTVTRTDHRYATEIRLAGTIDEHFALDAETVASKRPLVFDLGGVRRITSFGVRQWITTLKDITTYYCFVNCRPIIVSQFNMVANFGVGGELVTFFIPYSCPDCDREIEILFDRRDQSAMGQVQPTTKCTHCDSDADFDDSPESYFSYAMNTPPPSPPAHVATLLDRGNVVQTGLRARKEVLDQLTVVVLSGPLQKANALRRIADGLEGTTLFLLDDVTELTEEGAGALLALREAGVPSELAMVPPVVLERLLEPAYAALRASIVSLAVPFNCDTCGPMDVEIMDAPVQLHALSPRCERCGLPTALAVTGPILDAYAAMTFARPSPVVATYLAARRQAGGSEDFPPLSESNISVSVGTFDNYRLLKRIGRGGMAEVFLARQLGPEGFDRKVALKRILPAFCSNPEFVEMFLEEARLAARLSHPNIVQILELGRVGAQYFIAMEYVKGCDLQTLLRIGRANQMMFPTEIVCRIGIDLCAALAAAHTFSDDDGGASIVHRDVSPHNVLISEAGVVKLTDFGIARASGSHAPETEGLKGKVSYIAPERILGTCDPLDPRQDIYAVGLVLYVALTLQHPFLHDSHAATLRAVVGSPVIPPGVKREDIPLALDTIVMRALARNPDERYPTARAMQSDLENFLHQQSTPTTDVHMAQWLRRMIDPSNVSPPLASAIAGAPPAIAGSSPGIDVVPQSTAHPTRRHIEADTMVDPKPYEACSDAFPKKDS